MRFIKEFFCASIVLTLVFASCTRSEIQLLKEDQRSLCLVKANDLLQQIFLDEFEVGGYGSELCYLRKILGSCNLTLADVIADERERHLWTMRWTHETERRSMEYAVWRNTQCKGRSYQNRRSCLDSVDMFFEPTTCW